MCVVEVWTVWRREKMQITETIWCLFIPESILQYLFKQNNINKEMSSDIINMTKTNVQAINPTFHFIPPKPKPKVRQVTKRQQKPLYSLLSLLFLERGKTRQ